MPLSPGTKLGHYEIVEPIGKGGMGEVYRARDEKLGRDVAIKVLPEEFAQDKERLDRFVREAQLLAQLNHANIATLYGLEEHEGRQFLVMELVEGETLAERVARGPIPLDEAIPLFTQIAEGLEAAHDKRIVHRDLKPANIKLGLEGKPKILDFGLAKAFYGADETAPNSSQSPTLTRGTALGAIMGTASYMSPEQARGNPVDKRTDIWAFGCCLFEALTGKKAFDGETVSDIIGAVMRAEPDIDELPDDASASVRKLVRRCLVKQATGRLRDIGDARLELGDAESSPVNAVLPPRSKGRAGTVVLAMALGAVLASLFWWFATPAEPLVAPQVARFNIPITGGRPSEPALSPDGRSVVFSVRLDEGVDRIYRRDLDRLETTVLGEGRVPFFSPDGKRIGFTIAGGLMSSTDLDGGGLVRLGAVRLRRGMAWSSEGLIGAPSRVRPERRVLIQVSADGESQSPLTTLDDNGGETLHMWPQLLPGEPSLLFTVSFDDSRPSQLAVKNLKTGERRLLLEGDRAFYAATGHIVFARNTALWAAPFDLDRLRVDGPPVVVLENALWQRTQFAVSPTGALAYVSSEAVPTSSLVWVDRQGVESPILARPRTYEQPSLSPDGRKLAIVETTERQDIYVHNLEVGTRTRLTTEGGQNGWPVWSPDGENIVFTSTRGDSFYDLYRKRADGGLPAEKIYGNETINIPRSWSPDGEALVFYQNDGSERYGRDIWVWSSKVGAEPVPKTATAFNETAPVFSPDGKWLAYVTDESGQREVYATNFPEPGARFPISVGGGAEPLWSADGSEIYYRQGNKVVAVAVEAKPVFQAGRPQVLFEGPYVRSPANLGGNQYFDVGKDGRFLMIKPSDAANSRSNIVVVLNWSQELERLVPTSK